MSTITQTLKLIKPELSDNGRQTILDLASNMDKLDEAADIYSSTNPESGYWSKQKKIYYTNPQIGGYVGAVNIRSGQAAPKWTSLRRVLVGDPMIPTQDNGHYYVCTQSGYTAPFEPTWLVAANSITEDAKNKSEWKPQHAYRQYDIVVPNIPNDRFYVCTVSGTSGTTEPTWTTTDGTATSDANVVWMAYRIVKWKESGVAAQFRPFGKIE
ncbi:hypothetical protein [Paenibacillus paeoniae]|uniref:Uncharacterized protein n=1 Tax=Paenibacillus paeoniae TaxID=2292705 RepID=A0A371PJB8_9BACL|nr:hypothetical protein [Paenibacillus paeoniae]REK76302.1 hypothetical protein DX130_04450 [Paenibacillus paeoniae]